MKIMLILIILLLAVIGLLFWMGTSPAPAKSAQPASRAPAAGLRPPKAAPAQPGLPAATASAPKKKQRGALEMFTDYATGYTPLKVKQHSQNKLRNIQNKHNKALEKALAQ